MFRKVAAVLTSLTALALAASGAQASTYSIEAVSPHGPTHCIVNTQNDWASFDASIFYSSTIQCFSDVPLSDASIQSALLNQQLQFVDSDDPDQCVYPNPPNCGLYPLTSANKAFSLPHPREYIHRTYIYLSLMSGGGVDPWIPPDPRLGCTYLLGRPGAELRCTLNETINAL